MSEPNTDIPKSNPTENSAPLVSPSNTQATKVKHSTHPTKKPKGNSSVLKNAIAFFYEVENQSRIANIISLLMVFVTAILAWYTWKVFNQTTLQTVVANRSAEAANISAQAAKQSADLQKKALDSQIAYKKQSDIADAKKLGRDTLFINKQKQGIDSQISAIKQTQKQFEVSHSPYITVIGFGRNAADSLEIDIKNQGTQVAYMIEADYSVKAEKIEGITKRFKNSNDWSKWLSIPNKNPYNMQAVIAPGAGIQIFRTLKVVSDTDMQFVMQRKKIFFIRVMIYYFNTTTRKYMRYDYVAGWNPVDNLSSSIFFNYTPIKKYPQ